MSQLKTRDDVLQLIQSDFGYLMTKGFQVVEVDVPGTGFWAVVLEGKCRIRIDWYFRDGFSVMFARSGTAVDETWKWYAVDTLVAFLIDEATVGRFYEVLRGTPATDRIHAWSGFVRTHLDPLIELVASDDFEQRDFELKQLRTVLDDIQSGKQSRANLD